MSIEMNDLVSPESAEDDHKEEMATLEQFERCVDACGFGKYQLWLLSISFLGVLAHVSVMATTPYAFTVGDAKKYYKEVKSLIFLIPYLGMICSSIISGFVSDCFGRRKVIIVCYGGLAAATLLEGASRQYSYVLLAKFCEGLFLSGAFVASTILQAEFQTEKSRDRIMVTLNFFVAVNSIVIVLPQFLFSPKFLDFGKIGEGFDLDFWDISVMFNAVFCLAACLLYAWLPESPKSEFVHGRYKNALETLKRIYSMNTGKSPDQFPYQLLGMVENELKSRGEQVRTAWSEAKCIFKKPLLKVLIIIMAVQFLFMFGYNSMRLWHPTVVFIIKHSPMVYYNSTLNLCAEFQNFKFNNFIIEIDAIDELIHHVENCFMILFLSIIPYIVVTIFVNRERKLILLISLCICCCCIVLLSWICHTYIHTFVFGVFMAMGQLFTGLIQAIVVEIFPVCTKSLALSLALTASAIGAVFAEVLFSTSQNDGCSLIYVGAAAIAFAAIGSLFLPK